MWCKHGWFCSDNRIKFYTETHEQWNNDTGEHTHTDTHTRTRTRTHTHTHTNTQTHAHTHNIHTHTHKINYSE